MAVIQISKIQVRRGLQENLPQLASGEMGWSVDSGNLYIGNGTVAEGAPLPGVTQILTSNNDILSAIQSYTFKGVDSGYTSQTGPDRNNFVTRVLLSKLDDQVNFRDFITPQDISSNDYTVALQRAINEIYPADYYSELKVRRKLHIPAGRWPISSTITIPPYANLIGDGPRSTIIISSSSTQPVIQFRDSRGNVGVNINTVTSDAPFQITLEDMTLQSSLDTDIALIESSQVITFNRVRFQGNISTPVTAGTGKAGVRLLDTVTPTSKVSFNGCEFARISKGIVAAGNVSSVIVNNAWFDTLYQGIYTEANIGSPQSVKVVSSMFDNISAEAVVSNDNSSVTSAYNYYKTVGRTNGTLINSGTATTAVLSWNTPNNYSIGDLFDRTADEQANYKSIEVSADQPATLVQATTVGSVQDLPGATITLDDNTTANTSLSLLSTTSSAIIDYKITRGSNHRVGTIVVSHSNGTNVTVADEYLSSTDVGVTLSFTGNIGLNSAILGYTTSNIGTDATFKYTVRSFI
jgi:hypothetical protein